MLFAGKDYGLYISSDYGEHWTYKLYGNFYSISADGKGIFAGGNIFGDLYHASDNGVSWDSVYNGPAVNFFSLCATDSYLIAGAESGIFVSTNQGTSWSSFDSPSNRLIESNAIIACGEYLFAGSYGVWRRPISDLPTAIYAEPLGIPRKTSLQQNFPNPFNPSTTIRYGLPGRSQVTLSVYNSLGQLVASLVQGEQDAGYHEVKFDGSNLASGIYFYRIQAGTYMETKKLLLLR